MKPKFDELIENEGLEFPVRYAGRDERASPATGSEKVHAAEQGALVSQALSLGKVANSKTKKK